MSALVLLWNPPAKSIASTRRWPSLSDKKSILDIIPRFQEKIYVPVRASRYFRSWYTTTAGPVTEGEFMKGKGKAQLLLYIMYVIGHFLPLPFSVHSGPDSLGCFTPENSYKKPLGVSYAGGQYI